MISSFFTKRIWIRIFVILLLIIGAYFVIPVSGPIIFALLTALLLSPLVRVVMERTHLKRSTAVTLVFTLFLFILCGGGYFFITQIISQMAYFIENMPIYIAEIHRFWFNVQRYVQTLYNEWNIPPDVIYGMNSQVTEMLNNLRISLSQRDFIQHITDFVAAIPHFFIAFLVYLIVLFLFLLELPRIKNKIFSYLKESTKEKVSFMAARLSFVIVGFFKAQFFISIIIFIVAFIGLYFVTPNIALMMAMIVWLIDFIPIIGSVIILVPWSLYYFITGSFGTGIQLLVIAGVLIVIRRTLEPKVMGPHFIISPLATLISLYIGFKLLGIIGIIVGPLAVIAFTTAREANIIKLNFKL